MPHEITQCYLPPGKGACPPLPQPKLVLDLATPEGCKAELTGPIHGMGAGIKIVLRLIIVRCKNSFDGCVSTPLAYPTRYRPLDYVVYITVRRETNALRWWSITEPL